MENSTNSENMKAEYKKYFGDPAIKIGRTTVGIAFCLAFLPPVVLAVVFKVIPTFSEIISISTLVASAGFAWWIVEPISYFPVLGAAGSYMAFLSGNISNMRLPCAVAAQEAADAVPGTEKGELMATLGIAGSMITNLVFLTLGVLGGTILLNNLPKRVIDSFNYVLPAIVGSILMTYAVKRPVLAVIGIVSTIFLVKIGVLFIPSPLIMPVNVILILALAIYKYRKNKKEQ